MTLFGCSLVAEMTVHFYSYSRNTTFGEKFPLSHNNIEARLDAIKMHSHLQIVVESKESPQSVDSLWTLPIS